MLPLSTLLFQSSILISVLYPQRSVWWHKLEFLGSLQKLRVTNGITEWHQGISVSLTVCVPQTPSFMGWVWDTRLLEVSFGAKQLPTVVQLYSLTSLIPRLTWEWDYQLTHPFCIVMVPLFPFGRWCSILHTRTTHSQQCTVYVVLVRWKQLTSLSQ